MQIKQSSFCTAGGGIDLLSLDKLTKLARNNTKF